MQTVKTLVVLAIWHNYFQPEGVPWYQQDQVQYRYFYCSAC